MTASPAHDSILPETKSLVTIPLAWPSTTTNSIISERVCMVTVPAPICLDKAEYAPSNNCCPVCPFA